MSLPEVLTIFCRHVILAKSKIKKFDFVEKREMNWSEAFFWTKIGFYSFSFHYWRFYFSKIICRKKIYVEKGQKTTPSPRLEFKCRKCALLIVRFWSSYHRENKTWWIRLERGDSCDSFDIIFLEIKSLNLHLKEEKRVEQYICSAHDNAFSRVHDQRVKEGGVRLGYQTDFGNRVTKIGNRVTKKLRNF